MALVPFPGPHSSPVLRPPDDPDPLGTGPISTWVKPGRGERLDEPDDSDGPGDDDLGADGSMSFLGHLDELRKRIIRSLLGVLVGILLTFAFIKPIFDFVFAPTRAVLPPGVKLIYTQPGEAFGLYITVAFIAGAVVAAPFIMFQVWSFIAPALYSKEKRLAIPFVLLTTIGFLLGALFNHYIAFPFMMAFFATFNTPELAFMPRLSDVFGLYTKMLLAMGLVFQMPAIVYFLARMRLVTARFLWKHSKYAIFVSFIAAAIITPSGDPMNQAIFAAPMIALYFLSILIAWMVRPRGGEDPAAT